MSTNKLEVVLKLLQEKQNNPGNNDIETNFFNEALEYLLLPSVNHWWCTTATLNIARESLWLFSLPDHDPIVKYKKKLNMQLSTCTDCLHAYHSSKIHVKDRYKTLFPINTVDEFFKVIDLFDLERIKSTLTVKQSNFSMTNEIMCALLEIIYVPQLLQNPKCNELFGSTFNLIQQTGSFPTFGTETATYVFRMTLYDHRIVRFWARKLLEKFMTTDQYSFEENDFDSIKELLNGLLDSFLNEDQYKSIIQECPFAITRDLGEFWKSFRIAIGLTPTNLLTQFFADSNVSMPEVIEAQLTTSAEWLSEVLKTMTAMLLKMQTGFWGGKKINSTVCYNIVKDICEHVVFQTAMKIAREGNAGKILQRDGTPYPDDKLMAKIKSMLEWIYPYWSSLRHTPVEKDITQKILDTTFGYFQMTAWGVMSRAYCAELGLQIIDQCLTDDSVPMEKIDEYVPKIVTFAKTDASTLPALVQHMPIAARNILSDLVNKDSTYLNMAFNNIYQVDDDIAEDIETENTARRLENSPYESIWISVKPAFISDIKNFPWLAPILFKAYANVASADIPDLLKDSEAKGVKLSKACKNVIVRMMDMRLVVKKALDTLAKTEWETRKKILEDEGLIKPILHLVCSPYTELKRGVCSFIHQQWKEMADEKLYHDFFYLYEPLKVVEAFNSYLREFTALTNSPNLDVIKSVQSLISFLSIQIDLLTNPSSGYFALIIKESNETVKDEDGLISEFWDVCWRTMGNILDKGLQWASNHKASAVANLVMPILDCATQMVSSKKLFEKAISVSGKNNEFVSYDHVNTITDSLSHWIYVTRQDMISKLVPLLNNILLILKKAEIKISVEAYDRLMTAATGVNDSKLNEREKESLFTNLSAHEPTNFIFLNDDSDDEDVEWQPINTATTSSVTPSMSDVDKSSSGKPKKQRQMTLDQSFSNVAITSPSRPSIADSKKSTTPKITNYFAATADEPHEISDDDMEDEFGDMDYSQVPEEWFDINEGEGDAYHNNETYFGDENDPMDIDKATAKAPVVPIPISAPQPVRKIGADPNSKANTARFYPPENKVPTYAVTSKGRKLRPPSMGFTKMKSLREEFKAERRLLATAKSPSAAGMLRQRYGVDSQENSSDSSDSSSDEGGDDSGLLGLIYDMNEPGPSVDSKDKGKAESASVKALFGEKPKRTIKLLETPMANGYLDKKLKARAREQKRQQKIAPNLDPLYKKVFSWNVTDNSEIPPGTNEAMYNNVPSTFKTFEEYRAVFEPLLILETWSQLVRAKELLTQNDVLHNCLVAGRCHTNDFVDVTFGLPMSVITNNLSQDDLICVANHFGSNFFSDMDEEVLDKPTWRGKSFLGKVVTINQKKNLGEVVVRCYFASDRISILNSIAPKTSWDILKIMSLTTTMREYAALQGLEHYDLGQDIIKPQLSHSPKIGSSVVQQYCDRYDVNEPQGIAIVSAIHRKRGFSLIQGPPGTGKTKTILALIVSLLDQRQNVTKDQPYGVGKLLVCAPSNAAVDEIAKRLKEGVATSHGIRTPNIVRIGVADSVNASVKDRILDKLIEAEMDSSSGKDGTPGGKWGAKLDSLHHDIRTIQLGLDEVDREITQSGSDIVQMSILREKRKALAQKLVKSKILLKDTYQDQKNYGKELEISRVRARQKVFANADVVCATLSGSGHDMLTSMGVSFETVIVDEAAQSIEISSLIPLKFDTKRCILVGDPNQLPPTVISTLAAKYDYQQSLFMRLENTIAKEVNLLSIQYRMHPEISKFPSKMFYQSRLQDGPNMDKNASAVWHSLQEFPPYRFFNVLDGQEKIGRGKSIYNVAEADAAVALVDMLCTKLPTIKFASKIGVITPYKQQVSQLKSRFQKRFGSQILDVIDFNTVDGFQGQEKEIIIFSCVRAGSGRGIGFLADMRRMNVGLTRAKCSLFVIGHAQSLHRSDYWGDLVSDAQRRQLIVDCEYPYFKHRYSTTSVPQNIFEREFVPSKKSNVPVKRGPVKISAPLIRSNNNSTNSSSDSSSDEEKVTAGKKRPLSNDGNDEEKPQTKRKTTEDNTKPKSFIEKVRQDKATKQNAVSIGVPSATNKPKMTIDEYRVARGLPPSASRPIARQNSGGSNLFINKKKPIVRAKPISVDFSDGVSPRERAMMEHTAAKEKMREYRQEERRRQQAESSKPATPMRGLDGIMSDLKSNSSKSSRSSSSEQRRDRRDDRYQHDRHQHDRHRRGHDRY